MYIVLLFIRFVGAIHFEGTENAGNNDNNDNTS